MFPFRSESRLFDTNTEIGEERVILNDRFLQHQSKTVHLPLTFLSHCEHLELGSTLNIEMSSFRALDNKLPHKGQDPDKLFKLVIIEGDNIV